MNVLELIGLLFLALLVVGAVLWAAGLLEIDWISEEE